MLRSSAREASRPAEPQRAPHLAGHPSPGHFTIFWNGVMVHNRKELLGATSAIMTPHEYTSHDSQLPLQLPQHGNRVRFRNVWIRRLEAYDHVTSTPSRQAASPDRMRR